MIACFDAKYHFRAWRPVHAIQRADQDGNRDTAGDAGWQPLLATPNHPEYPSAHGCHSSAIAEALDGFFAAGRSRVSIDSLVTGETRSYRSFREVVAEVNHARVWAVFHFRYSQDDGTRIGRRVGRRVARRFFHARK